MPETENTFWIILMYKLSVPIICKINNEWINTNLSGLRHSQINYKSCICVCERDREWEREHIQNLGWKNT